MGRTRRQGAKSALAITGFATIGYAELLEGGRIKARIDR